MALVLDLRDFASFLAPSTGIFSDCDSRDMFIGCYS